MTETTSQEYNLADRDTGLMRLARHLMGEIASGEHAEQAESLRLMMEGAITAQLIVDLTEANQLRLAGAMVQGILRGGGKEAESLVVALVAAVGRYDKEQTPGPTGGE